MNHSPSRTRSASRWVALVVAILVGLLGAVLAGLGAWLIALGGSWYYALAGLGLMVTAVLMAKQRIEALWLYLLIWLATAAWAYWEVGLDWWAQVPRLVAPTILLVIILLTAPALARRKPAEAAR